MRVTRHLECPPTSQHWVVSFLKDLTPNFFICKYYDSIVEEKQPIPYWPFFLIFRFKTWIGPHTFVVVVVISLLPNCVEDCQVCRWNRKEISIWIITEVTIIIIGVIILFMSRQNIGDRVNASKVVDDGIIKPHKLMQPTLLFQSLMHRVSMWQMVLWLVMVWNCHPRR